MGCTYSYCHRNKVEMKLSLRFDCGSFDNIVARQAETLEGVGGGLIGAESVML